MADLPNRACRQSLVAPSRDGKMARAGGSGACQAATSATTALPRTQVLSVIPEVLP